MIELVVIVLLVEVRAMLVAKHVHSNAEFVECRGGCRGDVAQEFNVMACGKRSENAEKLAKVRESQEHT